MLVNTSQLVIRNLAALAPGRMLLVNPPADELATELKLLPASRQIVLFSQDYGDHLTHRRYQDEAISASFGAELDAGDHQFEQVIVFLSRERQRARMIMEMVSSYAGDGAKIWLVGEKRAGIKTSSRFLAEHCGPVVKLDAARHCMLFSATHVSATHGKAAGSFSLQSWFNSVQLQTATLTLSVASLPGVFSHRELDPGSRLLLENLILPKRGRVLDFGCGCGILGVWMKLQRPDLELVLSDSNALALAATRASLHQNAIATGAEVIASDVYSDIDGGFNLIVSNPPFHQGVATHYAATERFLQQSARRLCPKGQLIIVAKHFLRYATLLETAFGNVETLAERAGFRVYRCRQRGSG